MRVPSFLAYLPHIALLTIALWMTFYLEGVSYLLGTALVVLTLLAILGTWAVDRAATSVGRQGS